MKTEKKEAAARRIKACLSKFNPAEKNEILRQVVLELKAEKGLGVIGEAVVF